MKRIIYGCESRGDSHTPYLTRWTLVKLEKIKIYFHKFHRSDSDELHDHPWHFISIILWRGYMEETFVNKPTTDILNYSYSVMPLAGNTAVVQPYRSLQTVNEAPTKKKRIWPGMIIYRPATHAHRVELLNGKPAYTLVFVFKYVRQWGFFTKWCWQQWESYFTANNC